MANNYIRPLLEVYQMLEVTQQATGEHLAACIVGANYDLYRYGQEELQPTTFSSEETLIPFVYEVDPALDYKVDLDSVSVYAEGLEASLATFNNTIAIDNKDTMVIRLVNGKSFVSAEEANLDENLKGYPVNIGDVVYVTLNSTGTPKRCTVIDVVGAEIPAVITPGEANCADTEHPVTLGSEASNDISVAASAAFIGEEDTTYILQCTKASTAGTFADAEFKVTDTTGTDVATFFTITQNNEEVAVGTKGLKLLFNMHEGTAQLTVGDTFSVSCVAAQVSTTDFNGLQLDTMPVDVSEFDREQYELKVELRKTFTGNIPCDDAPDASWSVSEEGVLLAEAASLYLEGRKTDWYVPFVDGVGSLYTAFRVLVIPDEDEELVTISNEEDITKYFGNCTDPANELAFACYCCLTGSQGRSFYAIRTRGTDVDSFKAAVKKTEANDATYSFAPITDDIEVLDAVVQFNAEMSEPDVKKWRRTIAGIEFPGAYICASTDDAGKALKATITADASGNNVLVQLPDSVALDFKSLRTHGSTIRMNSGDSVQLLSNGKHYTIKKVLSSRELLLVSGPKTQVNPAMPIALWKADTPTNAVEYLSVVACKFNTRRALLVWCDHATKARTSGSLYVANKFLAAEVAGLSSAVLPQKSITRTEIGSVDKAARMYTQYTQSALDEIASKGVLVITQDTKNAACYIRHQLTTEMDKGNLYYEDSCTRNIDNISYALTDILEEYIGKANVTPSALRAIKTALTNALIGFTTDSTDDLIGPSLISWEDLTVIQDPTFKDRVLITVKLYLPLPLNNIKLYEMAYVATVTI